MPTASRPPPRPAQPAPQPAHVCTVLATLDRTLGPSTSRSAGTPPASRTWTVFFSCAAPLASRPPTCSLSPSPLHTACGCTPIAPPVHPREAACASPLTRHPPSVLTRQDANSLSAANKLRIRCAWAGTRAFASAGLWLELGAGKLPLKPSPRCACGRGRVYGGCLYTTARKMCVATTPTPT